MRLIDADQFGVVSFQGKSKDFIEGVKYILEKIDEAPTVEAYIFEQVQDLVALNKKLSEERPHGEWIEHRTCIANLYFASEYECSNCHDDVFQKTEWQFCPNCGASMRKEGDEE